MIIFLSLILAGLAAHFVNNWTASFLDISLRAMLDLIVFIAVYMVSSRYFKNLRD